MAKKKKVNPEENTGATIGKSWVQDCKRNPKSCAELLAKQDCRNKSESNEESINCLCGVEKAMDIEPKIMCAVKEKNPNLRSPASFKKNIKKVKTYY